MSTSGPITPRIAGQETFAGRITHTGTWPREKIPPAGWRVGVIGTGSSGIQAIPVIAQDAKHVTVFQRTANYTIPAHNRPLTREEIAAKFVREKIRDVVKATKVANLLSPIWGARARTALRRRKAPNVIGSQTWRRWAPSRCARTATRGT